MTQPEAIARQKSLAEMVAAIGGAAGMAARRYQLRQSLDELSTNGRMPIIPVLALGVAITGKFGPDLFGDCLVS